VRIAVDAMGADNAPRVEVEGALSAVGEADVEIVLVGDEARLHKLLGELSPRGLPSGLSVQHAPEVITMHDSPGIAVRQKKQSSMRICFDLVKSREADALVSAGNSGAMMASGLFVLGRSPGIERPAIVTSLPTPNGHCVMLDVGANVEPRPMVLAQFAVLGAVYSRLRHGRERPTVGLLSNGSEEHKGTTLTRDTHAHLDRARQAPQRAGFHYLGYVEGRDIFRGEVDVVVTDGFTGNVLLKGFEGLAEAVFQMVASEVRQGGLTEKLGSLLMMPALRRFRQRTDYAETGGAPLLGVEGVALISHGGSDGRAIKNAILNASRFARTNLAEALRQAVRDHAFLWDDDPASSSGGAVGGLPS
jgi:glycerol-3-phosphate acyltransferase PlsX